jgi:hypothetical protein
MFQGEAKTVRKDKECSNSCITSTKRTCFALARASVICLWKKDAQIIRIALWVFLIEAILLFSLTASFHQLYDSIYRSMATSGPIPLINVLIMQLISGMALLTPPFLLALGLAFTSQRIMSLVNISETHLSRQGDLTNIQYKRLIIASFWLALVTTTVYGACMIPAITVAYFSSKSVLENNASIEWVDQFTLFSLLFASIPALFVFTRRMYALPVIVEQDASYFNAFQISRKLTRGNRISVFLCLFLISGLGIFLFPIIAWFEMPLQQWKGGQYSWITDVIAFWAFVAVLFFLFPLLPTFLNVSYLMLTGRKTIADHAASANGEHQPSDDPMSDSLAPTEEKSQPS